MTETPDNQDLARQVAVLEERMNTMQANLSAALERFRADMERRDKLLLGILVSVLVGVVLVLARSYFPPA